MCPFISKYVLAGTAETLAFVWGNLNRFLNSSVLGLSDYKMEMNNTYGWGWSTEYSQCRVKYCMSIISA